MEDIIDVIANANSPTTTGSNNLSFNKKNEENLIKLKTNNQNSDIANKITPIETMDAVCNLNDISENSASLLNKENIDDTNQNTPVEIKISSSNDINNSELNQTLDKNSIGFQLQAARLENGLSLRDVAQHLHLSEKQVIAMENNQWKLLPSNPYLRGFICNYLKLLHLPNDIYINQLDNLPKSNDQVILNDELEKVSHFESSSEQKKSRELLFIVLGIIILLFAFIYYFFGEINLSGSSSSSTVLPSTSKNQNDSSKLINIPQNASNSSEVVTNNQEVQNINQPVPFNKVEANSNENKPLVRNNISNDNISTNTNLTDNTNSADLNKNPEKTATSSLNFSFSDNVWVTVIDATNQKIFGQINGANSSQQVSGNPPFRITIGKASATRLNYRGKNIDLNEYSEGDVARFTLE